MPTRRIEQRRCRDCNGIGSVKDATRKACRQCGGKGWVLGMKEEPELCKSCNGDGETKSSKTCSKCEGRGYAVSILETYFEEKVCDACEGNKTTSKKCVRCNGVGYKWMLKNCSRYQQDCAYCSGTGRAAVRQCERCQGHGILQMPKEREITPRKRKQPRKFR